MSAMATKLHLLSCAALLPFSMAAQSPLVTAWSHTWLHGQDPGDAILPQAADNHVTFDPVSNLVHVTVDAGTAGDIPYGDQVFTFSADGQDLTAVPAPYVGHLVAGMMDPMNREGTADLAAHGGTVWAIRVVNAFASARTAGSLVALRADGSRYQLGLGGSVYRGHLVVDAAGPVAIRSMESVDLGLHAANAQGWVNYSMNHPFTGFPSDACLMGGTIYTINSGLVRPFFRVNGLDDDVWPAYSAVYPAQIASSAQRIFYAYNDGNGGCFWGAETTAGATVWQRSAPLGIQVEEMQVDGFGRPWFIGNSLNGTDPPLLVVTASDGSAHDVFTYGAGMNDLAIGGGQAFITGRADAGSEATYLIAVSTDFTTAAPAPMVPQPISLYPQPAIDQLTIANADRVAQVRVVDLTGKAVQATLTGTILDVSRLSGGVYLLEAETALGRVTRRFVVAR